MLRSCETRNQTERDTKTQAIASAGEALAISIPGGEARVIRYFQERMPYGLFVPDVL
jgi:hypothetical protein